VYFFVLHSGQNPAEAEANFLVRACQLDTYGVDPHPVKVTSFCKFLSVCALCHKMLLSLYCISVRKHAKPCWVFPPIIHYGREYTLYIMSVLVCGMPCHHICGRT